MNQQAAIDQIGTALAHMRRVIGRRIMGRIALARMAPELDLSDLDVLYLIPPAGQPGVAVGDIARALRIDPSRASRLAAALVEAGFVTRGVAQEDARRAVLWRSARGEQIFAEIQSVKTQIVTDVTAAWDDDARATFAAQFERFVLGLEARLAARQHEALPLPSVMPDAPPGQDPA